MTTRTVSPPLFLVFMALGAIGCYHATVETGLTASSEVIEESFASSWIEGLVPPNLIAAQAKCLHGVAKVETQISFVNGLVRLITLGIYTPMNIKVTCAAVGTSMLEGKSPDVVVGEDASLVELQNAFARAAELSIVCGRPTYVKY